MFSLFSADPKKDHCNKTVDIYEDVSSPEVTQDNMGKPMTCWYRFRSFRGTPKDWILRIKFNKFKVGTLINASYCEGGYMQVRTTEQKYILMFTRNYFFTIILVYFKVLGLLLVLYKIPIIVSSS